MNCLLSDQRFHLLCDTAMFSHRKKMAELRVFEFRGMARYWFRAAVGPYLSRNCTLSTGNDNCLCLRCAEGSFFGSTTKGSVVRMWIESCNKMARVTKFLLPHHPRNGKGEDHPCPSSAVAPGFEFFLGIQSLHPDAGERPVAVAAASLWLALNLGGIGQRSRRGAGSITIQKLPYILEKAGFPAPFIRGSLEDLEKYLREGISRTINLIRDYIRIPKTITSVTKPPEYPMLIPNKEFVQVQVAPLEKEGILEEEARAEVMRGLKHYKNAVFGLPYKKTAPGDKQVEGRHASPLWIRLVPLDRAKGTWAMIQTVMKSATLPQQGDWREMKEYLGSQKNAKVVFPEV